MKSHGTAFLCGIFCLIVLIFLPEILFSAASLDTRFGNGGLIKTDFGIGDDGAFDLLVQPDGKIVVVGYSFNGAVNNLAVSRYRADGEPDPDFGDNGTATFSLGVGDSLGRSLTIQDDGKIIVAGSTGSADQDVVLIRLTDNGNLDDGFGVNGRFISTIPLSDERAEGVLVTDDGSILLVGTSKAEGRPASAMLLKLDENGGLDDSFGDDGMVYVRRSYNTSAHALAMKSDGSIAVAGASSSNGGYIGLLMQFTQDGELDTGFGLEGEAELELTDRDTELFDLLVREDGAIYATGYMHNGSYRQPVLARFTTAGTLDSAFGDFGIVQTNLGYDGVAYSMASRENGSLLLTGYEITSAGKDMILIEVDETGNVVGSVSEAVHTAGDDSLDQSARVEPRYLVTDLGSDSDVSRAIALTAEGAVLTAGYTSNGTDTDMVVLRYTAEPLPLSARAAGDSSEGVVTGKFFVLTLPVFNITRNSAASGGRIVARASEQDCDKYCEAFCAGSSDVDCETTCLDECIPQGVTERGVVWGVVPNPSYRTADDEEDDTGEDIGTEGLFPESSFDTSYNYEIVRSGQTSDGSGVGDFGSDINKITPDVLYYVRAYAVLEDESVIYGNQVSFRTSDSCFIATAAYGSILDPHVVVLRQFRDRVLQNNLLGRKLIAVYYDYSPKLADQIRHNGLLRALTRIVLLPMVGMSYLFLQGGWAAMFCLLPAIITVSIASMMMLKRIRGERRL